MADARGIRKPAKRGAATATPKPKKAKPSKKAPLTLTAPSTALARVGGTAITEQHSATFTREAQRLDDKIVKTIDRIGKDFVVLGEMFDEMSQKAYYRALGFNNFNEYLEIRYPSQSRTQVTQAMRIVRELTSGPNPAVSKDDIREMTRDNAEGLAKLKKQGTRITADLIEKAKTLPVYEFKTDVMARKELAFDARSSSKATELEPEVLVKRIFFIAGTTASNLAKAIEIIKYLGEGQERDKDQGLDDYVMSALVGEFLSQYAASYEEMKKTRNAEAIHAATMAEDAIGPEGAMGQPGSPFEVTNHAEETEAAEKPYNAPAACAGFKDDGSPCGIPANKGEELCWFHLKKRREANAA